MKPFTAAETDAMRDALALAARGRGTVEPNPMVGCVLLKRGRVVGRGYHRRFGGPHAEVAAIRNAKTATKGATLLVTLEPCTHQGKTPPCTDAIIAAGIKRVIYALRDPNPATAGRAKRLLERAGIPTAAGLLAREARALNAPYIKRITTGRPYVTGKWAMSLDGKIATGTGDSKWISSPAARRVAHRMRSQADAVMVGIGTVLADDPLLTARIPGGTNPLRIVVDSRARLPLTSQLVKSIGTAETLLITTADAPKRKLAPLEKAACHILVVRKAKGGVDLIAAMDKLGQLQITNLLLEGGGQLLGHAFDAGLVDRVAAFIAPRIVGGHQAPTPHDGEGARTILDALSLARLTMTPVGPDLLLEGVLR